MQKPTASLAIKNLKPRNPLVAARRFRRAGAHLADGSALRLQARRALERELDRLRTHVP